MLQNSIDKSHRLRSQKLRGRACVGPKLSKSDAFVAEVLGAGSMESERCGVIILAL